MRNLIEDDADVPERYEIESEEEGTRSKALMTSGKTSTKEEGVAEKLKEELLAELKNQIGSHTRFKTTSLFVACIREETISKKFQMPTMGAYNRTSNPNDHVINYKTFMELQTHSDTLLCKVFSHYSYRDNPDLVQ